MKAVDTKYVDTEFTCACGNAFTAKSDKKSMHLEVCNKCHPFFTGAQGNAKQTGNVEKFNRKYGLKKEA